MNHTICPFRAFASWVILPLSLTTFSLTQAAPTYLHSELCQGPAWGAQS